ncbi:hypothetical protein [Pelosinus sp. IPA-1]|uniref:hypothetical protein n=1 Tax=Pelosinus sp. IPA-1 TaxID=3029569 RepID=UPI0024362853|nr:hypothetical protein [Pelosinus sp. IPA-1]GMB01841.1 hypothetical protein PIPA1_46410 [Pelosinus sp. IPA-1]
MFDFMLYSSSLIIPIIILIPNLLWLLFPPINIPLQEDNEPVILTVFENIGRFGVTIIPLFYPITMNNISNRFYIIAMLLLLTVYYAGWFRFFQKGRNHMLLFLPLWHIPIPMAITPILYFFLAAGLLKSSPMFIAAFTLAIGHLPISYKEYLRISPK